MRTGLKKIQWCPGCGDTLIVMALKNAFAELGIESHQRVVVSGVGCSGKASQYIDGYAAETLHGRAIPFATGIKISTPEMHVVVIGGDGDGYGIGLGHFLHACKRNIKITYLVCNNENYALTTGQASPTTPLGAKTKTTPDGNVSHPFDPLKLALEAGATFAKSGDSSRFGELKTLIQEALLHDGFALIDIKQACPSFKRW